MITNAFIEAVNVRDICSVRIMMKDSLIADPTFKEFDEMKMAAKSIDEELYDEHDGEVFETDESKWDENYMNRQIVKLVYNFSRERIRHLKDVISLLRRDDIKRIQKKQQLLAAEKRRLAEKRNNNILKEVAIAAAAGFTTGYIVYKAVSGEEKKANKRRN